MQDCAITHTTKFSVTALKGVFGKQFMSYGLWPPTSPCLNASLLFVGDTVFAKSERCYPKRNRSIFRETSYFMC
jgi:hypothetical protein